MTWSTTDKNAAITLSNGNLTCTDATGGGSVYVGIRGTQGRQAGKYYFELKVVARTNAGNTAMGVSDSSGTLTSYLGSDTHTFGCYQDGNVFGNATGSPLTVTGGSGAAAVNDFMCICVDVTNKLAWWRVNGGSFNGSGGTGNPVTGANGFSLSGLSYPFFPICNMHVSPNDAWTANFGSSAFTQAIPAGFAAWEETFVVAMLPQNQPYFGKTEVVAY